MTHPEFSPPAPRRSPPIGFWIVVALAMLVLWQAAPYFKNRLRDQASLILPAKDRPLLSPPAFDNLIPAEKPIASGELAGKVVFINYWGPWCGFCLQEFPDLVELEKKYRGRADFRFVSVASNGSSDLEPGTLSNTVPPVLQQFRAEFPVYLDTGGTNRSQFVRAANPQSFGYPLSLVLDRRGALACYWIGRADRASFEQAIDDLLREPQNP